jgi:hypothetical protein
MPGKYGLQGCQLRVEHARGNISDPSASALAQELSNDSLIALTQAGTGSSAVLSLLEETYQELTARCGQLVTAQQ